MNVIPAAVNGAPTNVHAPAAATAAVVTYAAVPQVAHVIAGVVWSYDAAPTGGNLSITDGGTTIFSMDITAAGPGVISFPRPIKGAVNSAVVVTLASGAGAVVGKINASHWSENT